jgi:outer membrane protein
MIGRFGAAVFAVGVVIAAAWDGATTAQTLTLEEAVALAQQHSPLAGAAAARVAEASARTTEAGAALYPMLRLNSSYTASDNPVQVFSYALNQGEFSLSSDLNNPSAADNWMTSAQVGMRLFSGGRDWANRRAARSAEHGIQYMRHATLDEMTTQVTRAFLTVLTAQELVRSATASTDAYQASEGVIASRVSAGTALRTELLNIQVQRARAEERLLQATNALSLTKESLRLAIGLDSLGYTSFGTLDEVTLPDPSSETALERPEIQAQTSFVEAARAELRASQSGYFPAIGAFAGIDRFQGWEFDGTNSSWSAGITLEWTIFDGFLTRSAVSKKRARLKAAEEESRQIRLQTSVELTSASFNVEQASKRVAVMDRAVALAGESATLTRQRLEQGLAISSQVIDAENALVQAEADLAQAKADRIYAVAMLRRALGLPIIGDSKS